MVGDAHAMGVAAQILEAHTGGATERRFRHRTTQSFRKQWDVAQAAKVFRLSENSLGLPWKLSWPLRKAWRRAANKLPRKNATEQREWERKNRSRDFIPVRVIERQPTGRNKRNGTLGMESKFLTPGVQHGEEAEFRARCVWGREATSRRVSALARNTARS